MSMHVVPNPGQTTAQLHHEMYGGIRSAPVSGGPVGPANLPNSPAFGPVPAGPPQPVTPPSGLPGPIYPGPGWHYGPAVRYTGKGYSYGALAEGGNDDFMKFLKFGIVDNGLLIIMTAAGVGLDSYIAKKLNVPKGWGPLIGASVGNAISDGAAGLADGVRPAMGVTLGALLPVIPVFIAASVMKKKPTDKAAQRLLMGTSAAMVLWAYLKK
jgi:hypothetical protein